MADSLDCNVDSLHAIGDTAGLVWQFLNTNEPTSISKLVKSLDAPRDVTLQAVGWLAREGKLEFIEAKRGKLITLAAHEALKVA